MTTIIRKGDTTGARDAYAARLAALCNPEVDALLSGKDPEDTMHLFSGMSAGYLGSAFVRNPDLWCGPSIAAQLTGIHMSAIEGGWRQAGSMQRITPRHALFVGHYVPCPVGSALEYVEMDGTLRTTTVGTLVSDNPANAGAFSDAVQEIPGHYLDLAVVRFSSELPESIHITPILSLTNRQESVMLAADAPLVSVSQGNAGDGSTPKNRQLNVHTMDWSATPPSSPTRSPFHHVPVPGDSGTATFLLVGGILYLHGMQGHPLTPEMVAYINILIARADTAAGDLTGYEVEAANPTL